SRVPRFGRCLEIGAKRGGLSLWMASRGAESVAFSDLWSVERRAGPLHARYGVRVTYESIDATAVSYTEAFDVIAFKSVLGDLGNPERQRTALTEMHRALTPSGVLLFAENCAATVLHRWVRRLRPWTWRYIALAEMENFVSILFERYDILTTGVIGLAPVDRVLDRLCPPACRSII